MKRRRKEKSKDEIKEEFLRSMVDGQEYENADLKNTAEKVKRYQGIWNNYKVTKKKYNESRTQSKVHI